MLFQIYLIIINIVAFITFAVDKRRAIQGKWRISEATLFGLALAGGSVGGILAMQICRHKTKHWSFKLGLPLILLLQIIVYYILNIV